MLFILGSLVLTAVVLALLHRTPRSFKRRLTVACTFLAGSLP